MKPQKAYQNQFWTGCAAWCGLASPVRGGVVLAVVAVLVFALAACSTAPKVNTQAKAGTDFSRYHTFSLMPLPTTGPAGDPGLMLRAAEPARKAAVDALTAKGLTEAGLEQADLAINLRGEFLPKVQVRQYGYVVGPAYARRSGYSGGYRYTGVDVKNYEERTLTIEVFDNHTKELVWAGWSKRDATSAVDVEKLQEAIRRILAEFPLISTTPALTK